MNKKKNLMKLFTQDVEYNYHLIKTEDIDGHLIYVIKNGSKLDKELFEFNQTLILEELISECDVKIEKFAPSVFFTEENNIDELKYKLNDKLSEDKDFSEFIEEIKDEYRILEIKDSILYKKDPEEYEKIKQKEHEEKQKELWDDVVKKHQEKMKRREEALLEYDNNLVKLLKELLDSTIEFEKRDFNLELELEKIVSNLIDPATWIKIDENPFVCRIEPISLEKDKMNVFLTDNNDYSYTATLRFDKTVLITENVVRINKGDSLPVIMSDHKFLSELYDIDFSNVPEWDFKNDTDKFNHVIDHLAPIFKAEKEKKEKEFIEKLENEEKTKNKENMKHVNEFNNTPNNATNTKQPKDWYFDVWISEDGEPPCVALFEEIGAGMDDSLGSHSLSQNVIDALNKAGIYGDAEMMEAVWEVNDETRTKDDIIKSMEAEGFIYSPGGFN